MASCPVSSLSERETVGLTLNSSVIDCCCYWLALCILLHKKIIPRAKNGRCCLAEVTARTMTQREFVQLKLHFALLIVVRPHHWFENYPILLLTAWRWYWMHSSISLLINIHLSNRAGHFEGIILVYFCFLSIGSWNCIWAILRKVLLSEAEWHEI